MKNKSQDLKKLFTEWTLRKDKESRSRVYTPNTTYRSSYWNGKKDKSALKIFFYEWSNVWSTPREFNTMVAFDTFMRDCGIVLETWQRDVLLSIGTSHVACKHGKKDLCVRQSWFLLKQALEGGESSTVPSAADKRLPPME